MYLYNRDDMDTSRPTIVAYTATNNLHLPVPENINLQQTSFYFPRFSGHQVRTAWNLVLDFLSGENSFLKSPQSLLKTKETKQIVLHIAETFLDAVLDQEKDLSQSFLELWKDFSPGRDTGLVALFDPPPSIDLNSDPAKEFAQKMKFLTATQYPLLGNPFLKLMEYAPKNDASTFLNKVSVSSGGSFFFQVQVTEQNTQNDDIRKFISLVMDPPKFERKDALLFQSLVSLDSFLSVLFFLTTGISLFFQIYIHPNYYPHISSDHIDEWKRNPKSTLNRLYRMFGKLEEFLAQQIHLQNQVDQGLSELKHVVSRIGSTIMVGSQDLGHLRKVNLILFACLNGLNDTIWEAIQEMGVYDKTQEKTVQENIQKFSYVVQGREIFKVKSFLSNSFLHYASLPGVDKNKIKAGKSFLDLLHEAIPLNQAIHFLSLADYFKSFLLRGWSDQVRYGDWIEEMKFIDPEITSKEKLGKMSIVHTNEILLPFSEIEGSGLAQMWSYYFKVSQGIEKIINRPGEEEEKEKQIAKWIHRLVPPKRKGSRFSSFLLSRMFAGYFDLSDQIINFFYLLNGNIPSTMETMVGNKLRTLVFDVVKYSSTISLQMDNISAVPVLRWIQRHPVLYSLNSGSLSWAGQAVWCSHILNQAPVSTSPTFLTLFGISTGLLHQFIFYPNSRPENLGLVLNHINHSLYSIFQTWASTIKSKTSPRNPFIQKTLSHLVRSKSACLWFLYAVNDLPISPETKEYLGRFSALRTQLVEEQFFFLHRMKMLAQLPHFDFFKLGGLSSVRTGAFSSSISDILSKTSSTVSSTLAQTKYQMYSQDWVQKLSVPYSDIVQLPRWCRKFSLLSQYFEKELEARKATSFFFRSVFEETPEIASLLRDISNCSLGTLPLDRVFIRSNVVQHLLFLNGFMDMEDTPVSFRNLHPSVDSIFNMFPVFHKLLSLIRVHVPDTAIHRLRESLISLDLPLSSHDKETNFLGLLKILWVLRKNPSSEEAQNALHQRLKDVSLESFLVFLEAFLSFSWSEQIQVFQLLADRVPPSQKEQVIEFMSSWTHVDCDTESGPMSLFSIIQKSVDIDREISQGHRTEREKNTISVLSKNTDSIVSSQIQDTSSFLHVSSEIQDMYNYISFFLFIVQSKPLSQLRFFFFASDENSKIFEQYLPSIPRDRTRFIGHPMHSLLIPSSDRSYFPTMVPDILTWVSRVKNFVPPKECLAFLHLWMEVHSFILSSPSNYQPDDEGLDRQRAETLAVCLLSLLNDWHVRIRCILQGPESIERTYLERIYILQEHPTSRIQLSAKIDSLLGESSSSFLQPIFMSLSTQNFRQFVGMHHDWMIPLEPSLEQEPLPSTSTQLSLPESSFTDMQVDREEEEEEEMGLDEDFF